MRPINDKVHGAIFDGTKREIKYQNLRDQKKFFFNFKKIFFKVIQNFLVNKNVLLLQK
jgi:hypothetical protein